MGFELAQYEEQVSVEHDAVYKGQDGFLDHVRRKAGVVLADQIMRDASLYRRVDPGKNDPNPVVRHRWCIGIQTDKTELEARERDMEVARRLGLAQAAAIVRDMIGSYDDTEGHCKHVLVHQLEEITKVLQKHANGQQTQETER